MGWLLDELISQAGPNAEAEVYAAAKRARERFEPTVRELTGLRLTSERERATVALVMNPGLPDKLVEIDQSPEKQAAFLLGMYWPAIVSLQGSSEQITQLLKRVAKFDDKWAEFEKESTPRLRQVQALAEYLAKESASTESLRQIVEYDADVLGEYVAHRRPNEASIHLYWAVIGYVARQLNCSIDALTIVTLIHELTHAYTHLGADIEGRRWNTTAFFKVDLAIAEGLAQYYTHVIAKRLSDRGEPDMLQAFENLLNFQSAAYHAHLPWLERYSLEVTRAAVLEFRATDGTDYYRLVDLMAHAKDRLHIALTKRP